MTRSMYPFALFNDIFTAADLPQNTFPPYNVIKDKDSNIVIELAVAGFKKENLSVELDGSSLKITGTHEKTGNEEYEYIVRKLACRNFEQKFDIKGQLEVTDVIFADGILTIKLKNTSKKQTFEIKSNTTEQATPPAEQS